jgi:hypothetical protein
VISVRAEEMGRREKIAQERKYGGVSGTPEDTKYGGVAPEDGGSKDRKYGGVPLEDGGSKKLINTENVHSEAKLNFDEHHSDRLDVFDCKDNVVNEELNLSEDSSCDYCKAPAEQLKSMECQNELDSGQNTAKENHEERIFCTGSEKDTVDCSLGNFPNTLPRNGVLPFQSPNFQFSSNLAAMAVARSCDFKLTEDTFGDSESDSEESGPS